MHVYVVFRFLQSVAKYDKKLTQRSPNFMQRRHIFVRSYIKLVAVFTSKHKALIATKGSDFNLVIATQLNHMEEVVQTQEELNVILAEYFEILNQAIINQSAIKCFEQWLSTKPNDGIVIKSILHTLNTSVCNTEIVAVLFEATLNAYFVNNSRWRVISLVKINKLYFQSRIIILGRLLSPKLICFCRN